LLLGKQVIQYPYNIKKHNLNSNRRLRRNLWSSSASSQAAPKDYI